MFVKGYIRVGERSEQEYILVKSRYESKILNKKISFQGFIIIVMYVISGEVLVVNPVLHKLKRRSIPDDDSAYERAKGVYITFNLH